eukprot:TRINITY_DN473_c0_g1_i1.p1 TRINITY_DN473_c0_g1~~TRINITY_DN473_c0_g1_i1.p1  ORF type:complete len:256 (+),score=104.29 TRINITY_DN473_c0_g1_i1:11-778(+)
MSTFQNQLAGHGTIIKESEQTILKLINADELSFYQKLHNEPDFLLEIREFIPKYFGTKTVNGKEYFEIEDLTTNYEKACAMDLKMAQWQHTPFMTAEKIAGAIQKCEATTSAKLGLRLSGMKVYDLTKEEFELRFNRLYGLSLKIEEELIPAIQRFFWDGLKYRVDIIENSIESLEKFKIAFEKCTNSIRWFSSSLLFTYDSKSQKSSVKMIDFGQTLLNTNEQGIDQSYILGLNNLLRYLNIIKQNAIETNKQQ